LRILFDVNHPAHVHLFKNAIWELKAHGHEIAVTARKKEITTTLLQEYNIEHTVLSSVGDSLFGLAAEFIQKDIELFRFARSFNPDIYLGCNPAIAHVSAILGGTCLIFHDSEPTPVREWLFRPFADMILTPEGFDDDLGDKQVRYPGYHELAYLHPDRFEPDPAKLRARGVDPDERYFVLRFIAWGAHHDAGESGLSLELKRELVSELSDQGTVYITSEDELPEEFEDYRLPVPPHLMHHLISYATMYIGDSQTMATESAVLGTPAIRCNSFAGENDMSNFVELEEEYELLYSTPDEDEALERVRELVAASDLDTQWEYRRERMLAEKTDVTNVIVDTVRQTSNS
jgi:predicted glycosyltransferase